MELRRHLLILSATLTVTASAWAAEVKRFPLDDRASYTVGISPEAPTTVLFPDKITAIDGVNLSAKPDEAPVLLSHQAGTNYFSVRALRPDARAAVNVILGGKAIALAFSTGADPDRTVTFYEKSPDDPGTPHRHPANTARWLSLLDRAKNYPALARQYPALGQQIEQAAPVNATTGEALAVTVEEVFRFADEDALVFRLRLENRTAETIRYAASRLGIRTGETIYPAAITDASGAVPARATEQVWLAIVGEPDGRRADLSLRNAFALVWSRRP
ncbi:MAG: hypothetical protein PSU94_06360 [Lacunisphaera sp.]|nr:hypothetical protein [Lacunisphaera sp.]